jgi:hypothetical protein
MSLGTLHKSHREHTRSIMPYDNFLIGHLSNFRTTVCQCILAKWQLAWDHTWATGFGRYNLGATIQALLSYYGKEDVTQVCWPHQPLIQPPHVHLVMYIFLSEIYNQNWKVSPVLHSLWNTVWWAWFFKPSFSLYEPNALLIACTVQDPVLWLRNVHQA